MAKLQLETKIESKEKTVPAFGNVAFGNIPWLKTEEKCFVDKNGLSSLLPREPLKTSWQL